LKSNFINKLILRYITLFFFSISLSAQSYIKEQSINNSDSLKVKRISIGILLGIPNIAGGSSEIVLPILNNHFTPYIDYSSSNLPSGDIETKFSFIEYGVKYYFNKKGYGFFTSIGQSKLEANFIFKELFFSDNNGSTLGSIKIPLRLNTTNLKLGIKTEGSFFFRFEIGYGFGDIPFELKFKAKANGISESFTEDIPSIPGLGLNGILLANFGFGLAF